MYPVSDVLTTLRGRQKDLEKQIATPLETPPLNTAIQSPTNQAIYAASGAFVIR